MSDTKYFRVIHAAISAKNGIVYVGHRHHDCFATMAACGVSHIGATQGFVDAIGQFLTREMALQNAIANNQIIKKHSPSDKLMSEDLY